MRVYRYVGPAEHRSGIMHAGHAVTSPAALRVFDDDPIVTFVVTTDGILRIAPRRSEHVACAGGGDVLTAGELGFSRTAITYASNQSTGFCPAIESFSALAAALDAARIPRPATWTVAFEFRRCPACNERNIVKDDHFECALCGAELPRHWNFA